jgi:hypothetical protein
MRFGSSQRHCVSFKKMLFSMQYAVVDENNKSHDGNISRIRNSEGSLLTKPIFKESKNENDIKMTIKPDRALLQHSFLSK